MNMTTIATEYGLMTKIAPHNGQAGVQKGMASAIKGAVIPEQRGRLLAPYDPITTQQKADQQTATIT